METGFQRALACFIPEFPACVSTRQLECSGNPTYPRLGFYSPEIAIMLHSLVSLLIQLINMLYVSRSLLILKEYFGPCFSSAVIPQDTTNRSATSSFQERARQIPISKGHVFFQGVFECSSELYWKGAKLCVEALSKFLSGALLKRTRRSKSIGPYRLFPRPGCKTKEQPAQLWTTRLFAGKSTSIPHPTIR
jgi:hypothetical protein